MNASVARRGWTAVALVAAAASLVYPLRAVSPRLEDRIVDTAPTGDGMAYMATALHSDERGQYRLASDLTAIRWLRGHVDGSPVIMEAVTPIYRWGGRISVHTGLPAVLGWDYHESQQRAGSHAEITARREDVGDFYSTTDPVRAVQVLRRYDVRYVIVGELERAYHPTSGIEKIASLPGLRRVYSRAGVEIFERPPGA